MFYNKYNTTTTTTTATTTNNNNNNNNSLSSNNTMYEPQFMYDQDLYSTSPQDVFAPSLSPHMLNRMHDLSLNAAKYNSSPDSTTSLATDDFAWSDPMLPDLYPKPMPIKIKKLTKEPLSNPKKPVSVDPETHRRQLDEKLGKINFDDITVAELKEALRERGLAATGRKAELMHRLREEFDLVINQRQPHVLLNRRLGEKKHAASPKLTYHPYYTPPPPRHASLTHTQDTRLASSLPTSSSYPFLNDQFASESFMQPNLPYTSDDIWDDQMLQNFLNQI